MPVLERCLKVKPQQGQVGQDNRFSNKPGIKAATRLATMLSARALELARCPETASSSSRLNSRKFLYSQQRETRRCSPGAGQGGAKSPVVAIRSPTRLPSLTCSPGPSDLELALISREILPESASAQSAAHADSCCPPFAAHQSGARRNRRHPPITTMAPVIEGPAFA